MEKPYSPVFVNSCQPGPARSSPARLDKNKASPLQPSPVTKKASPTIPGTLPAGLKPCSGGKGG